MKQSVLMNVMSHLSDVQESEHNKQIKLNFVKSLLLAYKDTTVEIDPLYEWFARVAVPTKTDILTILAVDLDCLGFNGIGQKEYEEFINKPFNTWDLSQLSREKQAILKVYHTMHKTI